MENETKTVINGYTLQNKEKVDRAIHGMIGPLGALQGGVGENASDEVKIAEYDRIGGLILKGKYKVKTGSFYDFKKRAPRSEPEVVLVFRDIDGDVVEIGENEAIPAEVRAAEVSKEKKSAKTAKKKKEEDSETLDE